jgi:Tropinone reductase 1
MHQRWRLDGRTALITGASKGIGRATALELAALGADVLLVARDELTLETARDEIAAACPKQRVLAMSADLSDEEERL